MEMNTFVIILIVLNIVVGTTTAIPILNHDDTKLDSIVISEIDLPTEPSIVVIDHDLSRESESSFHELIEKYDATYIKSFKEEQDVNIHKRSSTNEEELDGDGGDLGGGKSIIEKVQIPDPDVRKEFLNELAQNQVNESENEDTTETANLATDYDPNYLRKTIAANDGNSTDDSSKLTVHEKEKLQVHLVEQLIHQNENDITFTTIVPDESFSHHEIIKNPEIIDVLEHIVYETDKELKSHEHTTLNPIIEVKLDIDPIEIIPKDRHRLSRDEIVVADNSTDGSENDKFSGFVGIPTEDLTQPGDETTEPDNFFKKDDEDDDSVVDTLRETLEYVAIYGKSLEIAETTVKPLIEKLEISTQTTINVQVANETTSQKASSSSEEESSQQLLSNKSSEEEDKRRASVKSQSIDSSEENSGKENFDEDLKSDLRSLEFPTAKIVTQQPISLLDDVFKSLPCHEIKKKDHPTLPIEIGAERKIDTEVVADEPQIATENTLLVTISALYETVEEITTTVSEGAKLTNDLTHNIQTFLDHSEENKIVLDTHREAISSKNSKAPLVGVNEVITLKERSKEQKENDIELAIAVIPYVAIAATVIFVGLFKLVKKEASNVAFY